MPIDNAYCNRCMDTSEDRAYHSMASGNDMYLCGGAEDEPDNMYIGNAEQQSPYLSNSMEDNKDNLYMRGGAGKETSPIAYLSSKPEEKKESKSDLEKAITGEKPAVSPEIKSAFEINIQNYIPIQKETAKPVEEEEAEVEEEPKDKKEDSKKKEEPKDKKPATLEDVFNAVQTKQISV